MPKLITGFLCGVLFTIGILYVLDYEPNERQEGVAGQPAANEGLNNDEAGLIEKAPVGTSDANEDTGERENTSPPIQSDSHVQLVDMPVESNRTSQVNARTANTSTTNPAQGPADSAPQNDYPPEIADMIENSVDKELQARYESDKREESWATYMEGQLAAYFGQKPELAQFNFSLIDCRTSICEIHALGYGPDALTSWNTATADIVNQSWHDFRGMSVNRHNPQPDVLGIVLILTRKVE